MNIADVVPDLIPLTSKSFLTYFLSSPVYEIGFSCISTVLFLLLFSPCYLSSSCYSFIESRTKFFFSCFLLCAFRIALFRISYSSLTPIIELMSTDSAYLLALNYVILFFLIESKASSIATSALLFS